MTVTESRGAPSWTLLAVDGDPYILAALRRVVRPTGWGILTTGRAGDAMAMLAVHPVDAVLSDRRMSDGDGLGLLERVSRGWPRTARALMTDEPDAAMLINAINHGLLHGCIIKPWVDDELVSMLRRVRQRQQLEAATHVVERLAQKHVNKPKVPNSRQRTLVAQFTEKLAIVDAKLERDNGIAAKKDFDDAAMAQPSSRPDTSQARSAAIPLGLLRNATAKRSDQFDAGMVDAFADLVSTKSLRQNATTLSLRTSDLHSGQTLAQDFVSPKGALLLSAGHLLNDELICRIRAFESENNLSLTLVVQTVE